MLSLGYATRDITPAPGITLCGFAARCNRPAESVADPLSLHALAVEQDYTRGLLIVFDLLGLGPEILEELHAALDERLPAVPRADRVFTCTHTHSAPATITLLGCGLVERAYWTQVITAACAAAADAWVSREKARIRVSEVNVAGENYNRRRILADGRVVMAQHPDGEVVKVGRTWDTLQLLRVETPDGRGIVTLAHWACHPCTVCTQQITADWPGLLRVGLSARLGMPVMLLQGACGDLNPPWDEMSYPQMLKNATSLLTRIPENIWSVPLPDAPFITRRAVVPLRYAPTLDADTLRAFRDGMGELAETGSASAATLAMMANILNTTPEEVTQGPLARYMAGTLREWAKQQLTRSTGAGTCDLHLTTWRLGTLAAAFIPAEVFVDYAYALAEAFPALRVLLVGYASPHVGYLPTDAAQMEGGYEVDQAYRFYNHPAPWALGTEAEVMRTLTEMLAE